MFCLPFPHWYKYQFTENLSHSRNACMCVCSHSLTHSHHTHTCLSLPDNKCKCSVSTRSAWQNERPKGRVLNEAQSFPNAQWLLRKFVMRYHCSAASVAPGDTTSPFVDWLSWTLQWFHKCIQLRRRSENHCEAGILLSHRKDTGWQAVLPMGFISDLSKVCPLLGEVEIRCYFAYWRVLTTGGSLLQ